MSVPTQSQSGLPLEKITVAWLFQNVPVGMWFGFGALLLAVFGAGVTVGNTTFVRELLGRQPQPLSASQVDGPAQVGFLAGDFVLDLSDPYDRPTLTKVSVSVRILRGSVTPLREAQLLKFEYDQANFDSSALGQVRLESVTPSAAMFSAGDASLATISLEFDSRSLVPKGQFAAFFRPGDRRPFGQAVVRLYFLDGGKKRQEDVTIQLMFEKRVA
jgi:hypothetical protein